MATTWACSTCWSRPPPVGAVWAAASCKASAPGDTRVVRAWRTCRSSPATPRRAVSMPTMASRRSTTTGIAYRRNPDAAPASIFTGRASHVSVMSALPPGPRSALLHGLRYARDPFGSSLRCLARYGDPFTAPTVFGPQVVTADPAVVEAVFAADPASFAATGAALLGPVMGASSVMLVDG